MTILLCIYILLLGSVLSFPYEELLLERQHKGGVQKNVLQQRCDVKDKERLKKLAGECQTIYNSKFKASCDAEKDRYDLNKKIDEDEAINWMKKCIVEYYCFQQAESSTGPEWKKQGQPSFKGLLEEDNFKNAAFVSECFFFKPQRKWAATVAKYKPQNGCLELLYITAARYVYVTYLLKQESIDQDEYGKYLPGSPVRLIPCEMDGTKYIIPNYACYPIPYGSASCTSDYDVGLVGPKSGELVANFNDKFKEIFNMPSEDIFDTNIYAFTLEYAMPTLFSGLATSFTDKLKAMEDDVTYQAQDLVSALYKVKKYRSTNYEELYEDLITISPTTGIPDDEARSEVKEWNNMVLRYELLTKSLDPDIFTRQAHNEEYNLLVKSISKVTDGVDFNAKYIEEVMLALLYAAEAYHSRGAMRYVVGYTQMTNDEIKENLTPLDIWCSMLENWGDSMKEYNHANLPPKDPEAKKKYKPKPAVETLVKMSKYGWRTWLSMKELREAKTEFASLPDVTVLEKLFSSWLYDIKKAGGSEVTDLEDVTKFYAAAGCTDDPKKATTTPLTEACIESMFGIIKKYNSALMKSVFPKKKG